MAQKIFKNPDDLLQELYKSERYGKEDLILDAMSPYEEIINKGGQLNPFQEQKYRQLNQRLENMRKFRG